jgi:two-component system, chemotaxis family, protein-glutamate methylesterase/glutaminase
MGQRTGVVAIGGSAGSIEALVELVSELPATLPVPVLVTVHIGDRVRSRLPEILSRPTALPVSHARQGEPLRPGRIYVAPPDLHLLVSAGVARLSSGPRVNRQRPAIDVMLASAARWAGPRTAAVVLSGMLDDGAVGSALVARAAGQVLVQDPTEAVFDPMPRSALAAVPAARVLPTAQLGKVVAEMVEQWDQDDEESADEVAGREMSQVRMAESDDPHFLSPEETRLTRLSCPDCSGGLAEIQISDFRYYRCHVGHQYSPQSLEMAQREAAEAKLWTAAAALEEHAALARHLARHAAASHGEEYRLAAGRSADTARSLITRLEQQQDDRDRGVRPGR